MPPKASENTHQLPNTIGEEFPVAIDRRGLVVSSSDHPDAGIAIATMEAYGAVDSWDEYLCVFRGAWGFDLNVYRYDWLGEIPYEWYDDEGELLPEHRDSNGFPRFPEDWFGGPIIDWRYGGFVGGLTSSRWDKGAQLSDCSESMIRAALESLRWPQGSLADVQKALHQLGAAAPSDRHVAPEGT
jgi:hypothetical protein